MKKIDIGNMSRDEALKIMEKVNQKFDNKTYNNSLKQKWIYATHSWQWWLAVIILLSLIYFF